MKGLLATMAAAALGCGAPSPAISAPSPSPPPAPATPAVVTVPSASTSAPASPPAPGLVIVGEIVGPPKFDPKPALEAVKGDLRRCYDESRTLAPDLHGKLTLQLRVNEAGAVTSTEAVPGGTASDPGLLACIADVMKAVTFPKPGGTATLTVPLVLRR